MLAGKQQPSEREDDGARAGADAHGARHGAEAPALAGDDAARLQRAVRRIHRHARPARTSESLSPTQVAVLAALARAGTLRATDLAAREGLNATLVSRVVAKLVDAGLARRSADPDDGRVARVEVTPRGRRLLEKEEEASASLLRRGLARLDETDRRALADALGALERIGEWLRTSAR